LDGLWRGFSSNSLYPILSLFWDWSIVGWENNGMLCFLGSGRINPEESDLILISSCVEAPLFGGGEIGRMKLVGVDDLGCSE